VANGSTNDGEINACILGFGDRSGSRIHIPDVVWYSGLASNSTPLTGITMGCVRKTAILIDDDRANPLINRCLLQQAVRRQINMDFVQLELKEALVHLG
jgi:hypothetical protein